MNRTHWITISGNSILSNQQKQLSSQILQTIF